LPSIPRQPYCAHVGHRDRTRHFPVADMERAKRQVPTEPTADRRVDDAKVLRRTQQGLLAIDE